MNTNQAGESTHRRMLRAAVAEVIDAWAAIRSSLAGPKVAPVPVPVRTVEGIRRRR